MINPLTMGNLKAGAGIAIGIAVYYMFVKAYLDKVI